MTFATLTETRYDLIVIGAGINGVAIARDAAMRGLRVAVFDKADIGSGTTSWSTRLIHGGLRYLEHAELSLVRESLRERERLLHTAPHLVAPLPLIVPIYEGAKRGPALMRVGMGLYDILSYDKSLDHHSMLNRDQALRRLPGLNPDGLKAAARYFDAQVTYPERLAVELARSAQQHGARIETYTQVDQIITEGAVVRGVEVRDLATGETATVQARAVINVTGPWVDKLLNGVPAGKQPSRQMGGTKGTHLVVPAFPGAPAEGLYVEARSDGRALFIVPWNEEYLIGTTDDRYDGDLDQVHATDAEISYLLNETNTLIPSARLTTADISFTYSGIRPLPYTKVGAAGAITRKHIVRNHAPVLRGLWSIIGGKLTTHRQLAEEAVDDICAALGIEARCATAKTPLPGAAGIAPNAFAAALQRDSPLPAAVTRRLSRIYGALAEEIVTLAMAEPHLAKPVTVGSNVIGAEVIYGFQREGAKTLEDLFMRRTMLGLDRGMGQTLVDAIAVVAGDNMNWSSGFRESQVFAYREYLVPFRPAVI